MLKSENLSGLANNATALINLGLTATAAELNYTDGVTSNIQTQLNARLPLAGGTMTGGINLQGTEGIFDVKRIEIADGTSGFDMRGAYFSMTNSQRFAISPVNPVNVIGRTSLGYSFANERWELGSSPLLSAENASSNGIQTTIGTGDIGTTELATGAVTSDKILDGTIVNADVNASAAIAGTKLAYDNTTSGLIATNVQAAIDELESEALTQVSSGEITAATETDLRSYSPADILAFINEHTTLDYGVTWLDKTANYTAELPDANGTIIAFDAATTTVLTLDSGEVFEDGALINIIALDADVEIDYGGTYTGENFSTDVANGIRNLTLSLKGTEWVSLTNGYALWEAISEYYTLANAANPTSDSNATTGATGITDWTVTSVTTSPTPQNGTYALKWTHGGPDNTAMTGGEIDLSGLGLAEGSTYEVKLYINRFIGGNFNVALDSSFGWTSTSGTGVISTITDPTADVWREVTLTATRSAAAPKIRVNANSNADTGNAIGIDNIRITLVP